MGRYVRADNYAHCCSCSSLGWCSSPPEVIFSSEPLFAALFGFIFLGEILRGWQWIGAALIVQAMVLALEPKIGK